ncbi:DotU family type IV/VI secretion system protein [Paraburkholderia sartisoli]|uniref:Type VI secretion system protein ImpK n=1 Tax=Paraburkholderia sartisoli TaxID=83784 RepID=A0A1H4HGZ6_9BURK|nr:DotU family type IV/VI secretion system protein [Paraburkholderia sartisoli]SEB21147.1 type VI secretion system protein ImpK [Paraburkholderia sartisoli]
MTTIASNLTEVPLIDAHLAASRQGGGIRDLLRDTALLVSMLMQGGNTDPANELRERCVQLMTAFSAALEQRGYAADVREDALYAQCGLLDEAVLRYSSIEDRSSWEAHPLQVERFGKLDAGDHVFERLEERMREASPNVDLLECYAAILGLGFRGRYACPTGTSSGVREGETKRAALIVALGARLENLRPAVTRTFIADRNERRIADWFYRFSPWGIAGTCCIAAAFVYLVWGHALDAQLAHLMSSAPAMKP